VLLIGKKLEYKIFAFVGSVNLYCRIKVGMEATFGTFIRGETKVVFTERSGNMGSKKQLRGCERYLTPGPRRSFLPRGKQKP